MEAWSYTKEQRKERFIKKMGQRWHEEYVVIEQEPLGTGLWQGFWCANVKTGERFHVKDCY